MATMPAAISSAASCCRLRFSRLVVNSGTRCCPCPLIARSGVNIGWITPPFRMKLSAGVRVSLGSEVPPKTDQYDPAGIEPGERRDRELEVGPLLRLGDVLHVERQLRPVAPAEHLLQVEITGEIPLAVIVAIERRRRDSVLVEP